MNLSEDLQKSVAFRDLTSFGIKHVPACASKARCEEVKADETYEDYIKRFGPTLSKRDEVFSKWMEGIPAVQKGYYRVMFAKGKRQWHGEKDKYPKGSHRHERWRVDPYVHSPDGRLLLFSHPSKGDVVLGITTAKGEKLVPVYVKAARMDRYAKALLAASKAVQALVGEESKLSSWDPRLSVYGTPLPSLVGMALEPLHES